ncbi:MAG: hypothetical protein FWH48_10020 [Oscillospiraceae bacterium]|nr:hypothetical protein [Oscillospiraceae bacterium]
MDVSEVLVFLLCGTVTLIFFYRWYKWTFGAWPPQKNRAAKCVFGFLPAVSFAIIVFTLKRLASFDVVGDMGWVAFYIIIGYAWIYFGLTAMSMFFDISWMDDALNQKNKAALICLAGGFIGLTAIYSGANIGDGPGWWCVIFAGGLGLIAWILLGLAINAPTKIFERITVGRDISCAIRIGAYFVASGIILARASAGDWTSFGMTFLEFLDGWPAIVLAAFVVGVEIYYLNPKTKYQSYSKSNFGANVAENTLSFSVAIAILYLAFAIASVSLLPPLPVNSLYAELAIGA